MNSMKTIFGFCLTLLFTCTLQAQSNMSWKKQLKKADELFTDAQYADAAEYYKAAWMQKPKKTELIYKAGESFYIIKDYKNAAEAFKNVKENYDDYPLIGLKYARALKQAGDYDSASRELVYFLNNYNGADKTIISEIVQNEIRGAELGIKLSAFPDENIDVQHLSSNVNTPATEFSPFAFNDETLYYSSTMAARAEIYRTLKVNGEWTKPERPNGFPTIENDHFCNGNLTPDNKRFYFTICQSRESWGGLTTECDLFVIKNNAGTWSEPERLRDYVNMEGSTATHPYTVHQNNTEILYFASNREGGKGGMDIWYMTRDLRSDDIDFTFPINCGSKINTKGDEISPFYDKDAGVLNFASNGLATIGGYDIFAAVGNKSQWEMPENVGTPINSSADDFFFVRTPSRKGGFFVSNRLFGAEKISTTDEDIFSFTDGDAAPKVIVKGNVVDEKSEEVLTGVMVAVSQYVEGGRKQFISNKRFADGNYYFEVLPGAEYEIEAQREGFLPKTYVFSTREEGMREAGKTLRMERVWDGDEALGDTSPPQRKVVTTPQTIVTTPTPQKTPDEKPRTNISPSRSESVSMNAPPANTTVTREEPKTTAPVQREITMTAPTTTVTTAPARTPTETGSTGAVKLNSDYNPNEKVNIAGVTTDRTNYVSGEGAPYTINGITTSAPRHDGTYYKVQLIAVTRHDPSSSRYNTVRGMGRMDTELIEAKNITRVLLADYFEYGDAKKALSKVRAKKGFERAYLVKYRDGERVGRVN